MYIFSVLFTSPNFSTGPKSLIDVVDCERYQTALHKAAWYTRRTICSMLVEAGASLTKTDYQGNTPRKQALKAEDNELAEYLESKGPIMTDV